MGIFGWIGEKVESAIDNAFGANNSSSSGSQSASSSSKDSGGSQSSAASESFVCVPTPPHNPSSGKDAGYGEHIDFQHYKGNEYQGPCPSNQHVTDSAWVEASREAWQDGTPPDHPSSK